MIDTVVLTIQQKDFKILNHNRFSPSTLNLFQPPYIKVTGNAPFKAVNNPTKADIAKFGYLPRLTLFKALRNGGFTIFLKIEFSIPKLLYGNNFDEVEESDFGEICWKVKERLYHMGIQIETVNLISGADVSTVHYSKNIILTDYSIPYTYLNDISKVNVNKLLDTNQTDFRNEGNAVKFHSNNYEVTFYDKLKDLEQAKKSDKRSIEKDNYIQMYLFDTVPIKKPFEVLRMEIRLGNRKKIKQTLEQNKEENKDLCFKRLFSSSISRKILLQTITKIESQYPKILFIESENQERLLAQLIVDNPKVSYKRLLALIGTKVLLQEMGTRKFRKVTDKFGRMSWYRLNAEMQSLTISNFKSPFDLLIRSIQSFQKVSIENYKENM